jgi:hypothetical protein
MGDIFEQYHVAQWRSTPESKTYAFPVIDIDEEGGNRVIERERAYRHGCKLDDTGSKARRWSFETIFENSIQEPEMEYINGSMLLYPDVLNELISTFDLYHDVAGDLYVPTRGWVRARLAMYRRKESPDEQDCARLTLQFIEDNEDKIDANAFTMPSVSANARRLAGVTTFDQQSESVWSDDSQSLEGFVQGIEDWMNAPGDNMHEVERQAAAIVGAVDRILMAFSKPVRAVAGSNGRGSSYYVSTTAQSEVAGKGNRTGRTGRDSFRDPESASAVHKLHTEKELAAQSRYDAGRGRLRLITVVFERAQSLVSIANLIGQPFDDLLAANSQLDDPLYIPPKTPVRIYEQVA